MVFYLVVVGNEANITQRQEATAVIIVPTATGSVSVFKQSIRTGGTPKSKCTDVVSTSVPVTDTLSYALTDTGA
jgi:hypothetical protein